MSNRPQRNQHRTETPEKWQTFGSKEVNEKNRAAAVVTYCNGDVEQWFSKVFFVINVSVSHLMSSQGEVCQ